MQFRSRIWVTRSIFAPYYLTRWKSAIETHDLSCVVNCNFVVAGGGFSGVEVVAEINDFVRRVIGNYRSLNAKKCV